MEAEGSAGKNEAYNGFTPGFEPLVINPSPGPLRLVKTPAAGHPLPEGEGGRQLTDG